jgi:hypothetical protein
LDLGHHLLDSGILELKQPSRIAYLLIQLLFLGLMLTWPMKPRVRSQFLILEAGLIKLFLLSVELTFLSLEMMLLKANFTICIFKFMIGLLEFILHLDSVFFGLSDQKNQ